MTAAALLLALCVVLQGVLFNAAAGTYDGFPPNVWVCSSAVGLPSFAAAAVWVWRGLRGARVMTWFVAVMAAPCCAGLGAGLLPGNSSPPASYDGYPYEGSAGGSPLVATWIVFSLSAAALVVALVLMVLPSSGAYFGRKEGPGLSGSEASHSGHDIGGQ